MASIHRQAVVAFTAEQMYNLVNDVETYPDFLPWCHGVDVLSTTQDEVRVTLHLAKGGLQKSFTTCNRLQKNKMIEVRLVSGPFHHLEGFWRFEEQGNGNSLVSLDMEFEFANRIMSYALEPLFNQIANSLVDAFSKRAEDVYAN